MKTSKFFISTQKEVPAEAEVISHRLMLRAGIIRRVSAGIYTWLPLGMRVLRKVEEIVRSEMNRAGAVELVMPVVQPAELWQESGRWQAYGPELLRLKDRHERDFVIQPTSEEAITDLARAELKSYRRLPVHFYQIQTKFRDERRPRFGIMRGREFVMKDGYSFHADYADLQREYRNMHDTYTRIFTRLGLKFRDVAADTGAIGGTGSHEFHVLADSGEDAIAFCPQSDYAANVELAEGISREKRAAPTQEMRKVPTPGKATCEDVAQLLKLPLQRTVKSIAVMQDATFHLLLVRGDHALNEIKTQKAIGAFRFASEKEIVAALHCKPGYIGPVGVKDVKVAGRSHGRGDERLRVRRQRGRLPPHRRELGPRPARAAGRRHPQCGGRRPEPRRQGHARDRARHRGRAHLPVAHQVFRSDGRQLSQRGWRNEAVRDGLLRHRGHAHRRRRDRAEPRRARHRVSRADRAVRSEPGADRLPQEHRRCARPPTACMRNCCEAGIDVLMDDRDERPGVLFADMELIGIPHRVVLSERGLAAGNAEYKGRRDDKPQDLPLAGVVAFLKERLAAR